MQVLHDLCVMAKADGGVCDAERALLYRVAKGLGLAETFVDQSLNQIVDLD